MTSYPDLSHHGFDLKPVLPSGDGTNGVLICAESPGEVESREGVPLHPHAPAGSMFERILRRAGLTRDHFTLTNVVWQRPPHNHLEGMRFEQEAIAAWRPHLERLIEERKPKAIVTLGNVALRALTAYGGEGARIDQVHSYVLNSNVGDAWVVPAFHPSYLVQGGHHLIGAVRYCIDRALQIAREGFVRKPVRYSWDNYDALLEFERRFDPLRHVLSFDIETPESHRLDEDQLEAELQPQEPEEATDDADEAEPVELDASYTILRVSLCYDAETGYAISVPWQPPFIEVVKRMMATTGPKRVWHQGFDVPRLRVNGVVIGGHVWDSMECWSYLQRSLPRALSFVTPFYGWHQEPWKHLNISEPGYYSCADAHALQQNGDGIERDLEREGKLELVRRHVVEAYEVLTLMSRNGLPYSSEKAQAFGIELEGKLREREATLQQRVPDDLKPSKQKQGLKRTPKDTTGLVQRKFTVLGSDLTEIELTAMFPDVSMAPSPFDVVEATRWCLLEPFLPTSSQQVQKLIKHYGHKLGRNRKTKRDSADREHMKKLIRQARGSRRPVEQQKGEVYQLIQECRKLSKVIGTYVKGWKPGRDGRIHATPGFWGKMYRVSWRRPNIAATIADKDEEAIASGFRKCVEASPGNVLIECDWKGMESVLTGWFAGDADFMRLARLGVHSFMCSHMLGRPADLKWSDDDLSLCFKEIKQTHRKRYDDAKHTVHGVTYGMGPLLMADLYQMPVAEAKRLIDLFFTLFPKVKVWQQRTLRQADKEATLTTPWGYKMWFWDVFRWDGRKYARLRQQGLSDAQAKEQAYSLGKDAKSAIAFLPRDTGAAMLKEAILKLRPLAEEGLLIGSAHDALLADVPKPRAEEVAFAMKDAMESPQHQLGGLTIGVDVKIGKAWDDESMELVTLPAFASTPPVLCSVNAS